MIDALFDLDNSYIIETITTCTGIGMPVLNSGYLNFATC